ncbi:hypothetical protein OQA88_1070 [Cercophora sp. LCS_1]
MAASKVFSVFLRAGELVCATIVLGILANFISRANTASVYLDGRITYGLIVACISVVVSIVCMVPFTFAFAVWPLDFILFVLWLVVFILFEVLTGINTCNAVWYYSYWGYYWGSFWRTPVIVTGPWSIGWSGCSAWKAVLAWSFIASMGYLMSSILASCHPSLFLGLYVMIKYREERKRVLRASQLPQKGDGAHMAPDPGVLAPV